MIRKRLLAIFCGALLGYIWGWIWGWSAFDPNLDVWALGAALLGMAGMVVGLLPGFWRWAGMLIGATLGLYLGWLLRMLLFGDVPGGAGLLVLLAAAVPGGYFGRGPAFQDGRPGLRILIATLYAGFFGGFLIDVVVLDLLLGVMKGHTVLSQGIAVVLCGVAGGLVAWQVGERHREEE